MPYYTRRGNVIYNPTLYAKTGAPMYKTTTDNRNINQKHFIYQINGMDGKKYIGKTTDINRMLEKYKNINVKSDSYEILAECNGIDSDFIELEKTNSCIQQYGFDNVITSLNTVTEKDINIHTNHISSSDDDFDEYNCIFKLEL